MTDAPTTLTGRRIWRPSGLGWLIVIGLGLIAFGASLGLIPTAVSESETTCGSPWRSSDDPETVDLFSASIAAEAGLYSGMTDLADQCADELQPRGLIGGLAAGLGLVVLIGTAFLRVGLDAAAKR